MHDEQASGRPWCGELLDLAHRVTHGAVVGDHAPRGTLRQDRTADVSHSGKATKTPSGIHLTHGGRRTPCGARDLVHVLQTSRRTARCISVQAFDCGTRCSMSVGAVTQPIDHRKDEFLPAVYEAPVVSADFLT